MEKAYQREIHAKDGIIQEQDEKIKAQGEYIREQDEFIDQNLA